MTKFSIIIPVFHGKQYLKCSLVSLLQIDYDPEEFEVITVIPQNDIGSRQIVSEFLASASFSLILIPSIMSQRPIMLNTAVKYSKGDYIAFIDDDCLVPPDWLHSLETFMSINPRCGIVGGRDLLVESGKSFEKALDIVFSSFWGNGGIRDGSYGFLGKYYPRLWNMCIRRLAMEKILNKSAETSVFDENLQVFEEIDLGIRVESEGYTINYNPMLYVYHYRKTNYKDFLYRNFHMGLICRNLCIHVSLHRMLVLGTILLLVLIIGSLFFEIFLFFLLFLVGLSMLVFMWIIAINLRKIDRIYIFFWIPLILTGLYLSRGMGYFTGELQYLREKTNQFIHS